MTLHWTVKGLIVSGSEDVSPSREADRTLPKSLHVPHTLLPGTHHDRGSPGVVHLYGVVPGGLGTTVTSRDP